MKKGDRIPGLIGWEWHGDPAPIPGLQIVATGATQSARASPMVALIPRRFIQVRGAISFSTQRPAGGRMVSPTARLCASKVYTEPRGPDTRVQQITKNILARMCTRRTETV
jgi:hypothetical protein